MRAARAVLLGAVFAALACTQAGAGWDPEETIKQATFTLTPGRCAGVVVMTPSHALTAAHCLEEGEERVEIELLDGRRIDATVALVDRGQDVAVLLLDEPAPVTPLAVADGLPNEGDGVWFSGRNDRPGLIQFVEIRKLAPCPSLPEVPQALHTTLRGSPGDSGAPIVDLHMQVVGLVHG
ncbi:MAG: serine protease, partial [Myxococcales bacterium]